MIRSLQARFSREYLFRLLIAACVFAILAAGCSAGRETSSSQQGVPVPARQLAIPYKVMLIGDGVMTDADPGLRAASESLGAIEVNDQAYWGFALSKPDWYDWRVKWSQLIDTYDPDAVVVLFGIHDAKAHEGSGVSPSPTGAGWAEWYRSQVTSAMDILSARQANVYWLGMLPVSDAAISSLITTNNKISREVVGQYATGRYLEPDPIFFSSTGVAQLLDPGSGLALRKDDGIHMCARGAGILGLATASAIAKDLGLGVGESFLTGQWQSSPSFVDHGPPNCVATTP